jgi:transposase-like protein
MEKVKNKKDKIKVIADASYSAQVAGKPLLIMKNTGNGYVCKVPSFSSTEQTNYICFDYAEAEYLRLALNAASEKGGFS